MDGEVYLNKFPVGRGDEWKLDRNCTAKLSELLNCYREIMGKRGEEKGRKRKGGGEL